METLNNKTIVICGGTGNVGSLIVKELLKLNANVIVTSRSEEKIQELNKFLSDQVEYENIQRLHAFTGNIGDEKEAKEIIKRITNELEPPDAVITSLGKFITAPSIVDSSINDLEEVIRGYLVSHFVVAKTFLPLLKLRGGTYIFINGPLALEPWEGSGAGLVSIATAGQQMLFKVLAQEFKNTNLKIIELITYAFIRNRQTQPGSPIPGEAVGNYIAYLLSEEGGNKWKGQTTELRSMKQLEELGF